MKAFLWIMVGISAFIALYAMVGYPIFLLLLEKIIKPGRLKKDTSLLPTVTLMIVAHNEEKVIQKKLENACELDYPINKLQILVASDNSTDKTDLIVEHFIKIHKERVIGLYKSKEHKGKTNAQNEAQKNVKSEILVMTDANSIFKKNALVELVTCFTDENIVYVCGALKYNNKYNSLTSSSEEAYWNIDLKMRDVESRIQTITAGNGAIYACKNKYYHDFDPIQCHDSAMPYYFALKGKRCIFNPDAIAYEKASENVKDEMLRKIRMNRVILSSLLNSIKIINIKKYKWFTVFYFGHRTCRYSLWLMHIIILLSTIILSIMGSTIAIVFVGFQCIVIVITLCQLTKQSKILLFRLIGYYGMTVMAQILGVLRIITKNTRSTWEKAASTR